MLKPLLIRHQIESEIQGLYKKRPDLAMVDSDKSIIHLHVPNNVTVDVPTPAQAGQIASEPWVDSSELCAYALLSAGPN